MRSRSPTAIRPAVLGLGILPRRGIGGAGEGFALVDLERDVALLEADLEQCERALVRILEERQGRARAVLPCPTLGGAQLASDVFWHAGWRIQRGALLGGHRLLDPWNVRRAAGSYGACRAAFERARLEHRPVLASQHAVILLHGLGRTRRSMRRLAAAILPAGLQPVALSTATTRATLERHADDLCSVLESLEARRVSFVTHSLGGIVLRAALARGGAWRARIELGRAVMLAPPSAGSSLSRRLAPRRAFGLVLGRTALELSRTLARLPAPPLPFAIVAGARGTPRGWNPRIEGDDDGVLSVAETRLPGAADHLVVRRMHTVLMEDRRVIEATLRFLLEGRLRAGPRVPELLWPLEAP